MGHIYSPHYISVETSQNISFFILPAAIYIYRHKRRQDLHLSFPHRRYSWLLTMSLQIAKRNSFAVRESGGANALDAMFRWQARPASGFMLTAELCSAERFVT